MYIESLVDFIINSKLTDISLLLLSVILVSHFIIIYSSILDCIMLRFGIVIISD